MPTYEYSCPEGHTFELFHRMSDPPPEVCAICGASPVKRLLSPVAVHFKGSGFYSTDYGRGKKRETGKEGDSGGETKKAEEPKTASASSGESSSTKDSGDSGSKKDSGDSGSKS